MSLDVQDLVVHREGTPVVKGVSFSVTPGELHVISGKNGAGKSTLFSALMGHPKYEVEKGFLSIDGEDVTDLSTHDKAKKGLFLSLQQPPEVSGVPMQDFLRISIAAKTGQQTKTKEFASALAQCLAELRLDPQFARRYLNEGFSGGEKKRSEILQLLMLRPKYALLDEPDSGLDSEALEYVATAIDRLRDEGTGFVVVTHYAHFLERLKPDRIWRMQDGLLF